MIFSHRVTPVFAVVVGCLIPVPGVAVTFVLWCTCCSFSSGRPTLHSACGLRHPGLTAWILWRREKFCLWRNRIPAVQTVACLYTG
jgi:hypothetical protein